MCASEAAGAGRSPSSSAGGPYAKLSSAGTIMCELGNIEVTKIIKSSVSELPGRYRFTTFARRNGVHEAGQELTIGWINAVRSSRQPLRGFLRMRISFNVIKRL